MFVYVIELVKLCFLFRGVMPKIYKFCGSKSALIRIAIEDTPITHEIKIIEQNFNKKFRCCINLFRNYEAEENYYDVSFM